MLSGPLPPLSELHGLQHHWALQGFHLGEFEAFLLTTEFGDRGSDLLPSLDKVLWNVHQMDRNWSQKIAHQELGKMASDSNLTSFPLANLTEDLSMSDQMNLLF